MDGSVRSLSRGRTGLRPGPPDAPAPTPHRGRRAAGEVGGGYTHERRDRQVPEKVDPCQTRYGTKLGAAGW